MSQTPPDPADLAYAGLLETFMAFPAPLALLDANGCTERINARFLQRFGADGVNAERLRALIASPQGGWQIVGLSPREAGGTEVRARAVRTADHILVIVEDPAGAGCRDELDALLARIGDLERPAATDHLDEALNDARRNGGNSVVVSRRGNSDTCAAEGGASPLHLVWQEAYECGDATIDGEHRELYRLANILIDAVLREQEEPDGVRTAVRDLLGHTVRHFADEEAILERLNYDQLPQHRLAHEELLRRGRMLASLLNEGKLNLDAIIEFFAQDVVAHHLMVVDRAFFPMFRKAAPAMIAAQTR